MADLGEVPFRRYYGSVNSTPLFVMLAGEYLDRTDDVETCRRLWPNIEAALGWIETYGDRDGDGLVEYGRRTVQGLAIRAGKTATMLFSTRTVCSPAVRSRSPKSRAMLFAAWRSAERIMRRLGQADRAAAYGAKAEALRARFDALFFDAEFGTYVLALDGDKKPCRVRASNAGHALFAGIALPERAGPVANVLMGSSSFCGWGIRTIASGEARYNPMSYHNGSVWPHDNALIAAGFARYGRREETARLFESLFAASTYVDCARLPELICGFPRQRSRGPTFYPVACSPQAWAAATPLYLLQSCLGPGRSRARPGPDRGSSDSPGLPAPPEETMRRSASPIGTAGAPTTRHNAWRRRMGRPRQEGFSSIEPEAEAKRAARGSLRKSTREAPSNLAGGRKIRCAIYTRKSSEEGLEQEFNSLDAQREACEAFVRSLVLTPVASAKSACVLSPDARLFLCRMADVAWRRLDRKMAAADRAVRDARTTESGL